MIRRPPRSTLDRSSAASDVYKRQSVYSSNNDGIAVTNPITQTNNTDKKEFSFQYSEPVSYTHLRAHETVLDLVCRLLLETKKKHITNILTQHPNYTYKYTKPQQQKHSSTEIHTNTK